MPSCNIFHAVSEVFSKYDNLFLTEEPCMYKIITATKELKFIGAQTEMYAAKCTLELYCKIDS